MKYTNKFVYVRSRYFYNYLQPIDQLQKQKKDWYIKQKQRIKDFCNETNRHAWIWVGELKIPV